MCTRVRTPSRTNIQPEKLYATTDLIPKYAPHSIDTELCSDSIFNEAYNDCYYSIFDKIPSNPNLTPYEKSGIIENSINLRISLHQYISSIMVGHSIKKPLEKFPSKLLSGQYGKDCAALYLNLACSTYGNKSIESIMKLLPDGLNRLLQVENFNSSEKIIAYDIISKTLLKDYDTNTDLVYASFVEKERQLYPEWLAINPVYLNIPDDIFPDKKLHALTKNNVLRVRKICKTKPTVAKRFYIYYESTLQPTLAYAIEAYNIEPKYIMFKNKTVSNSIKLWLSLGKAVRQIEIIKAVNRRQSVFNKQ